MRLIALALAGGIIAIYFIDALLVHEHRASILGGHIFYEVPRRSPPWVAVTYLVATCVPLLISSLAVRRHVGQERQHSVIIRLRHWIDFMIVAASAIDRQR